MSGYPPIKTVLLPASEVEISLPDALRYMGFGGAEPGAEVAALAREAIALTQKTARYAACSLAVPVAISGDEVDLGVLRVKSASLARHLSGCGAAVLFAATTGMEAERRRKQASVTSGARAFALDAAGSAAIERFCDLLCRSFAGDFPGKTMRPRFSPGYGDLPLETQRPLLGALDAARRIGVTLTDALMMMPQKSVSAVVGVADGDCAQQAPACARCNQKDCAFRR